MGKPLADAALDQVFRTARTRRGWTEEETPEVLIRATYDLLKLAPTASNICPGRFMFIRSPEAKARLDKHLDEGKEFVHPDGVGADRTQTLKVLAVEADSGRILWERNA